jgi:hypothetical protein
VVGPTRRDAATTCGSRTSSGRSAPYANRLARACLPRDFGRRHGSAARGPLPRVDPRPRMRGTSSNDARRSGRPRNECAGHIGHIRFASVMQGGQRIGALQQLGCRVRSVRLISHQDKYEKIKVHIFKEFYQSISRIGCINFLMFRFSRKTRQSFALFIGLRKSSVYICCARPHVDPSQTYRSLLAYDCSSAPVLDDPKNRNRKSNYYIN